MATPFPTSDLTQWLAPFLARLGHKARRRMCPLYVAGLIGPGDRKSVEPMAARLAPGDYDQLHHFISSGVWDEAPLEEELAVQTDKLIGGPQAVLVIDDTALPKKGSHSVGVAPQYASALGKNANCQTLVSLTLARNEVPVMIGLRLFLPESWISDADRLTKAGVPDVCRAARTKPEIALAEIDRILAAGVRFGAVLADAGYGLSSPFRRGLDARGLSGERKYYLANLPAEVDLKTLAAAIKARWVCEQAHQQLKEELGLDHFEGRSWHGLHRHALMTMIAYAYLQSRRLAEASGGKKNRHRPAAADLTGDTARRHRHPRSRAALPMSPLPKAHSKTARINLPK